MQQLTFQREMTSDTTTVALPLMMCPLTENCLAKEFHSDLEGQKSHLEDP